MSGTSSLKEFSFKDLKVATRNFSPEGLLGEGGFGTTYKGWVDENTLAPSTNGIEMTVAIKLWNPTNMQGFQEWQSGQYPIEAAFQVAQLSLKCLESNPQSRLSMTMKEVVEVLKEIEALEDEIKIE